VLVTAGGAERITAHDKGVAPTIAVSVAQSEQIFRH